MLFSGGIDSLACAHYYRSREVHQVSCTFIAHSQAAEQSEQAAASLLSDWLGLSLHVIRCDSDGSQFSSGELVGRNLFLLSTALFFRRLQSGIITMGLHAGTPYYDCSEDFASQCNQLVTGMTDGAVQFECPFLSWSKAEVFQYVVDEGLPYESAYSCEAQDSKPCGKCASCRDLTGLADLRKSV